MNKLKLLYALIFTLFIQSVYAASPTNLKQFINHKDWSFVENKGQLTPTLKGDIGLSDVKYYSHSGGAHIYCQPGKISFVFTKVESENNRNISEASGTSMGFPLPKGAGGFGEKNIISTNRIDLFLINSNPQAQITATDQQKYYENYYTTGDANKGITNVHTYKTIIYKEIYPHIDLILHSREEGMKYEFIVNPGGNAADIQIQWNGLERIKKLKDSKIEYIFPLGNMTESTPISYMADVGADLCFRPVHIILSRFLIKNNQVGFTIGKYDKTKVLVIDPTLDWATYFGGVEQLSYGGISTDVSGNVFISGHTVSNYGIATFGSFQPYLGDNTIEGDAFLEKFSKTGSRLWGTYYGGTGGDYGLGLSTDALGYVYMTGQTSSISGIASLGAYQTTPGNGNNAFLAKFSPSGSRVWATYFGGSTPNGNGSSSGQSVSADQFGNVFLIGVTSCNMGIATPGAYQTSFAGTEDAFVAKFNNSGSLLWATYFGGAGDEIGNNITTDPSGNVFITGSTQSISGIATVGAYQTSFQGGTDAFIAKFTSSGKRLWASYYGGNNYDEGTGVCVDVFSNAYIVGFTESSDKIATTGAYQTSLAGAEDAFLVKFNSFGSLLWGTYYGGSSNDDAYNVSIDVSGNVYIVGTTSTKNTIPSSGAFQTSYGGGVSDAFLANFNNAGKRIWATYFGGSNRDDSRGVSTDVFGNVYIVGNSTSTTNIATSGAYQTSNSAPGPGDVFLAKFSFPTYYDAGITSILSGLDSFCPSVQSIKVNVKNFGNIDMDSVKIGWSVNSKIQKALNWTGKLLKDSIASVNLGSYNFKSGYDTIKAWTTKPNGQTDSFPGNDTALIVVKVFDLPAATAGPDTTLCYDQTYTMQGAGGITYLWTPAKYLDNDTIAHPKATLPNTQLYTLVVRNKQGCADSAQVLLKVRPKVVAGFTITTAKPYKTDSSLFFNNLSINASKYLWNFGDKDTSFIVNPDHIYNKPGDYKIRLIAYGLGGCPNDTSFENIDIVNVTITVKIFVPNSFSPNGDGINDFFEINGIGIAGYTYNIYNRWGELIYENLAGIINPRGSGGAWDGKFKGQTVMEGVYIYTMDVTDAEGFHHYLNGAITVLK